MTYTAVPHQQQFCQQHLSSISSFVSMLKSGGFNTKENTFAGIEL
jgi:hypothetical protein